MKKIIFVLAICAVFLSCKKEVKPEPPYLEMPNEVWDYINLSLGSWYIYKDSATGVTDSVEVTDIIFKKEILTSVNQHYEDQYTVALAKTNLSGNSTNWLYATSTTFTSVTDPNPSYWQLWGGLVLMQYPSNLPGSPSVYKIPSAIIEGNVYSEIMVVASDSGVVWWVKGIGIVKLIRTVGTEIKTSLLLRKK